MSITYLEAIREAQAKLLREDERVFIYGQDVGGTFGGAFKATKGLAKEFPNRVLNTPISEDAIVGTAIGAAIKGMRPIVEMQFADFSSTALNQILNHAGTHYWRTNIPVPISLVETGDIVSATISDEDDRRSSSKLGTGSRLLHNPERSPFTSFTATSIR